MNALNYKKLSLKFLMFVKFENPQKIVNLEKKFFIVFSKRKCSTIAQKLKVEQEDGREIPQKYVILSANFFSYCFIL